MSKNKKNGLTEAEEQTYNTLLATQKRRNLTAGEQSILNSYNEKISKYQSSNHAKDFFEPDSKPESKKEKKTSDLGLSEAEEKTYNTLLDAKNRRELSSNEVTMLNSYENKINKHKNNGTEAFYHDKGKATDPRPTNLKPKEHPAKPVEKAPLSIHYSGPVKDFPLPNMHGTPKAEVPRYADRSKMKQNELVAYDHLLQVKAQRGLTDSEQSILDSYYEVYPSDGTITAPTIIAGTLPAEMTPDKDLSVEGFVNAVAAQQKANSLGSFFSGGNVKAEDLVDNPPSGGTVARGGTATGGGTSTTSPSKGTPEDVNAASTDTPTDNTTPAGGGAVTGGGTSSSGSGDGNTKDKSAATVAAKKEGLYDPMNDAGRKAALIGSLAEAIGIGMNYKNLLHDRAKPLSEDIQHVAGNSIRLNSPEIYNPAVHDIKANDVRMHTLVNESGQQGLAAGVQANTNAAILKAAIAQGNADAQAANKTAEINARQGLQVAGINSGIDKYNSEKKIKEEMFKTKMVNGEENGLFKGFKNLGTIGVNTIVGEAKNDIASKMYKDKDMMAFLGQFINPRK